MPPHAAVHLTAPDIAARAKATAAVEYASIRHAQHCPQGMYIYPQHSLFTWDGVLFVHQGYYSGSVLRFAVTLPSNYPERPPSVQFVTDVFHPLVSPHKDGTFSLAARFGPDLSGWKPQEHHVFDVLHFIKAAFKKHALDQLKEEHCLNKEAFHLYRDNTSSFAALATQSCQLSQSHSALFDKDHPSIAGKTRDTVLFQQLSEGQLSTLRQRLNLMEWTLEDAV